VRKTCKEQLRPTLAQEAARGVVLWRCRTLDNTAREHRRTLYRQRGIALSRFTQEAELKDLRAALPEYAAIHSHVLQDVLARLDKTYQAFFRRVANGDKPGFPRFQGKDRYHSFTYKEYGNGAHLANGSLVLSKIGRIAIQWSRPLEGTPKTVTVRQEADGWYVAVSCAAVPAQPLPQTGRETGIDVGLKVFLITADGDAVEHPRHYRHKTARALVRGYDVLYVEAIQPSHLSRRPAPKQDEQGHDERNGAAQQAGLNQRMLDAGWRPFLTILADQAACAGKRVEAVTPAYTSQECSGCGERISIALSVRTPVCPHCGLLLDRDANAAKNSFWRGQRLRGLVA
jgi:putative transposase